MSRRVWRLSTGGRVEMGIGNFVGGIVIATEIVVRMPLKRDAE